MNYLLVKLYQQAYRQHRQEGLINAMREVVKIVEKLQLTDKKEEE